MRLAPQIFTTGAFLKPIKTTNSKGEEYYMWVVTEFIDDSFYDGEVYNPKESGKSLEELITVVNDD